MSRFAPYLGMLFAIILGIVATVLSNKFAPVSPAPQAAPTNASSTISVVPALTFPLITLPSLPPQATSSVTSTSTQKIADPEKTETVPPKVVKTAESIVTPTKPASVPVAAPAQLSSSGSASLDMVASSLRDALVNILCYAPATSGLHSISGSGVFIDEKGIILTNAHIAQYFLLSDRGVSCAIRTGSPATSAYKVALIYISPLWIHTNATVLTQAAPIGNGEYDFALLAVTKSATSAVLPVSFSFLPLAKSPPSPGIPVVIGSYGAQFLESSQIQSSLFPTLVFGSVKDVFTFVANTIDVLALGGSAAAQEGSSGGGVVDASGSLVGTITTSTVQGSTDTRSLDAITASYIRAEYASEMGSAIDLLLSEPIATAVADFAQKIPALELILTANLP